MNTTNLSTLKIHKLTRAQYDRELAAGRIDENALYLTPDEEADLSIYATTSDVANTYETKANASSQYQSLQSGIDTVDNALDGHTGNSNIHVTAANKTNWNAAYDHSQAAHARTDATKVADSTTNGNILINGTETNVYTHPTSGVTAGTYKSVTVNAQGHITGGTNPTTLAGYGITDAESKGAASSALADAKEYTDTVAAGKASSTHNHDGAYDAKGAADTALASAKTYADSAATAVKNDLLNGAGAAYDTLKELGDLIVDNKDAIDALEEIASGKANAEHTHAIADVSGLQSALDGKAAASHGTHVTYSATAPVMDGTASVGSAATVARSDHKHPTDTSRASQADLDALETVVSGKANATHAHEIADITDLQTTLDGKAASSHSHTITATATDDDVIVLTGTNGSNKVTFDAKHATSGVTAGTYKSITVDAYGHVTGGSNPTTISGYGITDAYTKTQVDSALSGKANTSHGNHVPTIQTANNATFLRNDNTWQKVTPANIGAAASSHGHSISEITNLQTTLNNASSAITENTNSINTHTTQISTLQAALEEIQEITSSEIQALFA